MAADAVIMGCLPTHELLLPHVLSLCVESQLTQVLVENGVLHEGHSSQCLWEKEYVVVVVAAVSFQRWWFRNRWQAPPEIVGPAVCLKVSVMLTFVMYFF